LDSPLSSGVEFATAAQQWESVYGSGRAHHAKAEKEAPSLAELNAARDAAKANPTPENVARHQRLLAAFKAYHDLPTEHDAFATETEFQETWDETP
jgi:hypothetical protein